MVKHETQQFAKFFIKDLKIKTPKYHKEKSNFDLSNLQEEAN